MKKNILLTKLLFLIIVGYSQNNNTIDLSKWYKMDSVVCDLNSDGKLDVFRIYNNSTNHSFTDYGYPVLLYSLNKFIIRFDKVLVLSEYEFKNCLDGNFTIIQMGEKRDRNRYYMHFNYDKTKNTIQLVRTQVFNYVSKSRFDSTQNKRVKLDPVVTKVSEKICNYKISEIDFFKIFKDEYQKE